MGRKLLMFDDGRGRFGPMTDCRAVFECRSGAVSTLARVRRMFGKPDALHVPPRLIAAVTARCEAPVNEPLTAGDWLLINGRWPGVESREQVQSLPLNAALVQSDGQFVAAHVGYDAAQHLISSQFVVPPDVISQQTTERDVLLERPWHLLDRLEQTLADDLATFDFPDAREATGETRPGVTCLGDHAAAIAPDAIIRPQVVINTEAGPVVIDSGARVEPFVSLAGPCYIGCGSVINPHTAIRPNTVIGPSCKIGGEVSFSILEGYSNKAHDGYLGHAMVGKWVNLGGGTIVSNLKNTYGHIRVQLAADGPAEDTGRTFLGPLMGDFTLTAVGSRILTGSCIGTGTMLAVAGFAPKHTQPFSFITDDGVSRYELERFLDMVRRMTQRRCCGLGLEEETLLRKLHAVSAPASNLRLHGS